MTLMTPDELAKALGVSTRTLQRLNAAGKLDSVPWSIIVGRKRRYRLADVERWIEQSLIREAEVYDLAARRARSSQDRVSRTGR